MYFPFKLKINPDIECKLADLIVSYPDSAIELLSSDDYWSTYRVLTNSKENLVLLKIELIRFGYNIVFLRY